VRLLWLDRSHFIVPHDHAPQRLLRQKTFTLLSIPSNACFLVCTQGVEAILVAAYSTNCKLYR